MITCCTQIDDFSKQQSVAHCFILTNSLDVYESAYLRTSYKANGLNDKFKDEDWCFTATFDFLCT